MAWIPAVVGAAASIYGANKSNKASKDAGKVDVYSQVTPMGGTEPYRNAAANRAYELTFGKPAPLSSLTDPDDPRIPKGNPQLGLGGRQGGGQMDDGDLGQYTPIASGATVGGKGKKGKGAGGGGGKAKGAPSTTKTAIDNAMRVAGEMEKSPTVAAAQDYAAGTLAGRDQNPYREETAGMLRTLNETGAGSNYSRLMDELWGADIGLGNKPAAGAGPAASGSRASSAAAPTPSRKGGLSADWLARNNPTPPAEGAGPAPAAAAPPLPPVDPGGRGMVGIEQNLEGLLAGQEQPGLKALRDAQDMTGANRNIRDILSGQDAPWMAGMRESIKRQGDEALAEQQRALRLRSAGSGTYGGSGQALTEGEALGDYGGYLANANAGLYRDLYGQALGLGSANDQAAEDRAAGLYGQGLGLATQYDISAADRASREKMNADSIQASSSASGAALEAEMAGLASRERMGRLGILADMTGQGLEQERFRTSGMGSLGEGMSADQRNALSLAGDTNALGQAGWLGAGGLSLGADQTNNALRASLASTGVARQSLQFDKDRYYREAPMRGLAQYSGLISGLYDPYSTRHDFGFDARSQSPSYSNPAAQGLAGAAAGYQFGKDMGW